MFYIIWLVFIAIGFACNPLFGLALTAVCICMAVVNAFNVRTKVDAERTKAEIETKFMISALEGVEPVERRKIISDLEEKIVKDNSQNIANALSELVAKETKKAVVKPEQPKPKENSSFGWWILVIVMIVACLVAIANQ